MFLWEVFVEFAEAAMRSDRSWWPFVLGVITLLGAGLALVVLFG